MANIILRPDWHIPDRHVTPEGIYRSRRRFLRELGLAGTGLMATSQFPATAALASAANPYPPKRNPAFDPGWRLTNVRDVLTYNNFYEFSTEKDMVHQQVGKFVTEPWPIKVHGLCEKPLTIDARELVAEMGLEERVYRFRCVEAWGMIVPWAGFELNKLLAKVKPKSGAKFVRFVTALRPEQMPGVVRLRGYPWPYTEGIRLDEAMHPLTLVATGLYGRPLAKQNGAPIRLVVPWKYGFKSIKSIVEIELVATQPATLWHTLGPEEYPFESNVEPAIPHPRWTQATERVLDTGDRIRTLHLNGYADQVGHFYKKG